MQISIVNHSNGGVSDEELQRVLRAINRQITEDFAPHWGMSASLRLEGRRVEKPDTIQLPDLRGDAVIYLWNEADIDGAIGYHDINARGIPFGFVFTEIAQSIGEPWSVALSPEALELIGDPETNFLVMGPHPSATRDVFHRFETCGAVENEIYEIDGISVSNFVLPLYFTGTRDTDEEGARNDFLGRNYSGQTLKSFRINPGGYVGFFDPTLNDHDTFSIRGDAVALMRLQRKSRAKQTRRAIRYRSFGERLPSHPAKTRTGVRSTASRSATGPTTREYASISPPKKEAVEKRLGIAGNSKRSTKKGTRSPRSK